MLGIVMMGDKATFRKNSLQIQMSSDLSNFSSIFAWPTRNTKKLEYAKLLPFI